MSSFTVKTNNFLRNLYKDNRTYATKSNRTDIEASKLQSADEKALRNGIAGLSDFDYEDTDKNDLDSTKKKYYHKLKAFVDSYNYTIESGEIGRAHV